MMTDIPAGKVPVVQCVVASWRFLFDNWRLLLPGAIVVAIVTGVVPVLLLTSAGITQGAILLSSGIELVANILFSAMILRKSVRNEFNAPVGLSFGQDEIRLLGVVLSFGLLLMPFFFVFGFTLMFVAIGQAGLTPEQLAGMQNDPVAVNQLFYDALRTPPGIILCFVMIIAALLVLSRLSPSGAATIGERRIVFFQTWNWSKGNVLRVAAALMMAVLPLVAVNVILSEVLGAVLGPQANALIVGLVNVFLSLVGTLGMAPVIALGAELYRGLKPANFVAK
jgi:hypothetical protein